MLALDWLADQIAADFADRNVTINGAVPGVTYGAEKGRQRQLDGPGGRIIVGLRPDFEYGAPAGPRAPGPSKTPSTADGQRSVMSRVQKGYLDVKVPPPPNTERDPERSLKAHRACAELIHEATASLFIVLHGSMGIDGFTCDGGTWQGEGTADLHYPAQAFIEFKVAIPVLAKKHPVFVPSPGPPEPPPLAPSAVILVDPGDRSETIDVVTPAV